MTAQTELRRARLRLVGLVLLPCLVGCSSDDPDAKLGRPRRVPVTGVVTFKGRPIADADVTFTNETANTTGTGRTDSEGQFALTTFRDRDGAVPGAQKVAIRRVDVVNKTPANVDVSAGGVGLPPEIHWIVPEKYSDLRKSGLTASVTESGPNHIEFALK